MTENTIEQVTPEQVTTLIPHALYAMSGLVMIAVDDKTYTPLMHVGEQMYEPNEHTELLAEPGSEDWVYRMARARTALVRDLVNERNMLNSVQEHLQNLGNALLEEAERRGWCSEYDEFAAEWDLPTRFKEYDVVVTVRVKARDEDEAQSLVRDEVNISSYSGGEWLVEGPEYSAEMAY